VPKIFRIFSFKGKYQKKTLLSPIFYFGQDYRFLGSLGPSR